MWILRQKIKYAIISIVLILLNPFKMIAGVQKLYDYFFDKKLYSNNILLWREKKARKLGSVHPEMRYFR
jgi:hypothetical protein